MSEAFDIDRNLFREVEIHDFGSSTGAVPLGVVRVGHLQEDGSIIYDGELPAPQASGSADAPRGSVKRNCVECGREFTVGELQRARVRCAECTARAFRQKPCERCGRPIPVHQKETPASYARRRFCSKSCAAKGPEVVGE